MPRRFPPLAMAVLVALVSIACVISFGGTPASSNIQAENLIGVEQGGLVEGPDGSQLRISPGAISEPAQVSITNIGPGEGLPASRTLQAVGDEFQVDLGEALQTGEIVMSLPLATKGGAAQVQDLSYVVFAEPDGYKANVVGVALEEDMLTFPLVGSGNYQVFQMVNAEVLGAISGLYDPLSVPTYRQSTPAWCSPTALTNLVQYHEGDWPVGGVGSEWGESSNWWLAGKAGQPATSGYFFHWLLGAGGYSVPNDVKQSFSNGNAEVIIWNWYGTLIPLVTTFETNENLPGPDPAYSVVNYAFADSLYEFFRDYIEMNVWGQNSPRRPVAWGSSLAGHSRTITGSDGEGFFYNDPGSGSLNQYRSWTQHKSEVMTSLSAEKVEIIDTVVLEAQPRPENQRRGVLWLAPGSETLAGDISLFRGTEQELASTWIWDGSGSRESGYYYDDRLGELEPDSEFDHAFTIQSAEDLLTYRYLVFNISPGSHDFTVEADLFKGSQPLSMQLAGESFNLSSGQKMKNSAPGEIPISDLAPGRYTLKLTLKQGAVVQDVKYVHFRIASLPEVEVPELIEEVPPFLIFERDSFCRAGPSSIYEPVTGVETGLEAPITALSLETDWLQVGLFEDSLRCWVAPSSGELVGDPSNLTSLPSPPTPTPEPADEEAPSVEIRRSPSDPRLPEDSDISFSASASDNVGVMLIEIYLSQDGGAAGLAKSCNDDNCSLTTSFDPGEVSYWAVAYDQAGNEAMSNVGQVSIYPVAR